jgi:hypothetical protein
VCAREVRDAADQQQRRGHGEPPYALRGVRAQQADAHTEKRGDEHEVEIEPEHADVASGVADERQLEEEDEERVGGEAGRRGARAPRGCW